MASFGGVSASFRVDDFAAGVVSGAAGVVVGQPLSLVILRMQTAGAPG